MPILKGARRYEIHGEFQRAKHAAGLAKFAGRIKNLQGAVLEKVLFCQVHEILVDLPSNIAQSAMECSGQHSHC